MSIDDGLQANPYQAQTNGGPTKEKQVKTQVFPDFLSNFIKHENTLLEKFKPHDNTPNHYVMKDSESSEEKPIHQKKERPRIDSSSKADSNQVSYRSFSDDQRLLDTLHALTPTYPQAFVAAFTPPLKALISDHIQNTKNHSNTVTFRSLLGKKTPLDIQINRVHGKLEITLISNGPLLSMLAASIPNLLKKLRKEFSDIERIKIIKSGEPEVSQDII